MDTLRPEITPTAARQFDRSYGTLCVTMHGANRLGRQQE